MSKYGPQKTFRMAKQVKNYRKINGDGNHIFKQKRNSTLKFSFLQK
jgi:hypothetical protein